MAGERRDPALDDRIHNPARPDESEDASRTGGTRRGSPDRDVGAPRREVGSEHGAPGKQVDIDRER
jgi:hypothetical protein